MAYMKWRTPKSYKEIVTILLENGIINGVLSEKFKDAINMRNILVYNYIYIEPGELYSNTRNLIHPLNRIMNYIISYMQEKNIDP
ncbi:MAG: DUF86 domain-containing protein [Thaumarchaeota archaeon]|nr:DUF86 domain-containing protein [Candidatus Geocrenenecus arthurdayi]